MHARCGDLKGSDLDSENASLAPRAVCCTNYLIWGAALASKQKPATEFIIILEDDVLMSEDFWPRIQELLHSDCQDWDYLAVDTFDSKNPTRLQNTSGITLSEQGDREGDIIIRTKCIRRNGEVQPLYTLAGEGTHTQIMRSSVLGKFVHFAETWGVKAPLDHWTGTPMRLYDEVRSRMWQPKIVTQQGRYQTFSLQEVPSRCGGSVSQANIRD